MFRLELADLHREKQSLLDRHISAAKQQRHVSNVSFTVIARHSQFWQAIKFCGQEHYFFVRPKVLHCFL